MPEYKAPSLDPKPLIDAAVGVYNSVTTVISKVVEQSGSLSSEAQKNINEVLGGNIGGILEKLDSHLKEILDKIKDVVSTVQQLPPPLISPPIDPLIVLKQIADGIQHAENILNQQSLIIASGSVEIELDVKVGNEVGGHAKITFQISPKPYN